ncbi:hypothetical protein C8F01DRAFT_646948, partial [Mycena amicta]
MSSLPDELISIILSPAFEVPDEHFSDTSPSSPFANSQSNISEHLLVCKAWLRVATPLLYSVVVLRSKEQAKALETALKSNSGLGRFVKKLRVEGGYGLAMKTILASTPNVIDLFLSLDIWTFDSVGGLCQGLHLIQPRRLILYDQEINTSLHRTDLVASGRLIKKLVACMMDWRQLTVVDIPWSESWQASDQGRSFVPICDAVQNSLFVETVIIPSFGHQDPETGEFIFSPLRYMDRFLQNPSIKKLHIKDPLELEEVTALETWLATRDARLGTILTFDIVPSQIAATVKEVRRSDPHFVPMQNAPRAVQDKIWTRILYFALDIDAREEEIDWQPHGTTKSALAKLEADVYDETVDAGLVFVSKQFARLAIPYLYRYVLLHRPGQLQEFCSAIVGNPFLANHVQSIIIEKGAALDDDGPVGTCRATEQRWALSMQALSLVLKRIVVFAGDAEFRYERLPFHWNPDAARTTISWDDFRRVALSCGWTLQQFYSVDVATADGTQDPTIWSFLPALKYLEWTSPTKFDLDVKEQISRVALFSLETLVLGACHESFLKILGKLELPALRRVYFETHMPLTADAFLGKHGHKLTEVMLLSDEECNVNMLDACPNLLTLVLQSFREEPRTSHRHELISPTKPHLRLEEMILDVELENFEQEARAVKLMGRIESLILAGSFPALRTIRLTELLWPITERQIAATKLILFADRLWDKNIRILDATEKWWKPRLSSRKKR